MSVAEFCFGVVLAVSYFEFLNAVFCPLTQPNATYAIRCILFFSFPEPPVRLLIRFAADLLELRFCRLLYYEVTFEHSKYVKRPESSAAHADMADSAQPRHRFAHRCGHVRRSNGRVGGDTAAATASAEAASNCPRVAACWDAIRRHSPRQHSVREEKARCHTHVTRIQQQPGYSRRRQTRA